MGRRVDIGIGRLFERKTTLFEGTDDFTFSLRRDEDKVGIVRCDKEKRTAHSQGI